MKKQKVSPTGQARTTKTVHSPYASLIWCFVDTNLETSLAFPVHSNAPHRQVCGTLIFFISLHPLIHTCDNLYFVSTLFLLGQSPLISPAGPSLPFSDELLRLHPTIFPKYGKVALLGHISMIHPVSRNTTNTTTSKYQYSLDSPGSFGQMMSAPKCWLYVDLKPHAIELPASIGKVKKPVDKNNSKKVQIVDRQQPGSTMGKEKKEKKRRLKAKSPPSEGECAPGSAAGATQEGAAQGREGDGQPKSKKRRLEKAQSKEIPPSSATHVVDAVIAPPATSPVKATAATTPAGLPSSAAEEVELQSPSSNGKRKRGKRTRRGVDKHPETTTNQPAPVDKVVVVHQTEQPQSAPATEVIQGSPVVRKQQQHHEEEVEEAGNSTPATLNLDDIKKKDKKERKKRQKREKAAIAAAVAALKGEQRLIPAVVPPSSPPSAAAAAVQKQKLSHVEAKKVDQKCVTQPQKESPRNEGRPAPIAPGVVEAVAEPQQGNKHPTAAAKVDVEEEEKKEKKNALPVPVPVPADQPANGHIAKESSPSQSCGENGESSESDSSTTTTTASSSSSSDDDDEEDNPPAQSALPPSGSIPFNELLLKASLQMKNKKTNGTNDKGKEPVQETTQKQATKGTTAVPSTGETAVTNNNDNKKIDKPKASAPEVKFQWQQPYTSFTSKNVKTLLRTMVKEALVDEHKTKEGSQSAKLPKDYWVRLDKPDWWPLEGFNTDCFKRAEHCAKLYDTLREILANMHGVDLVANPKV